MDQYIVLDVFSYLPKKVIDIEQLEEIFYHGIDDPTYSYEGYHVEKCTDATMVDLFAHVVNELKNENKSIALIKRNNNIAAVIGYRK